VHDRHAGWAGRAKGRGREIVTWFDQTQRATRWLGVAVGVVQKRRDDGGGQQGALIGHYLFMSAVPMIVVLTSLLSLVIRGDPDLRRPPRP